MSLALAKLATLGEVWVFHRNSFDPRSFSTYSWKMDGEPEPAKRSGVMRLWLIEYYTQELAKKQAERDAEAQPAPTEQPVEVEAKAKSKRKKRKVAPVSPEVQALVDKAESDLDKLAQSVEDVSASQRFIFELLNFALDYPPPDVVDFMQVAIRYQERMRREDDDLLLLALVI